MLVEVNCAKCIGINAVPVTVEVDIRNGIGIHLVGLADTAVKESLLRTVTALQALDFHVPGKKIIINLAPADLHKNGSGFDLPIAIGVVAASGQRALDSVGEYLIMGELGLDGSVREVPGALAFAQLASGNGLKGCILPEGSAMEAAAFKGIDIYGVRTLSDAVSILENPSDSASFLIRNSQELASEDGAGAVVAIRPDYPDFEDIVGQEEAKRGVEIAAAGGHNIIMIGSPGAGKSSLAKALAGILPPMSHEESLVTSKLYSVAGKGDLKRGLMKYRPVRSPHYSASLAAIIGGGNADNIQPGEISLAQNGVLFLDEIALMPRSVMEALRGPLEDRKVVISRLKSKVEYPASFMLVAASNPCPCGYYGEGDRCSCSVVQRLNYLSRLSGPIMDRIDLQIWLKRVPADAIARRGVKAESSAEVAARVRMARERQRQRFAGENIFTNSEMDSRQIAKYCPLDTECIDMLTSLVEKSGMSMRAYYRIIKVARTIADLENSADIQVGHIAEAACYRFLDKQKNIL